MSAALGSLSTALTELVPGTRHVRVAVTGLARAGKTALLASVAANLLAFGAGLPVLPLLAQHLARRRMKVTMAPAGAADLPRFDHAAHIAALAADPPRWPERTQSVSLLAFDLTIARQVVLGDLLPPKRIRLELLDYPGEWLLDLPLLAEDFRTWSEATLARLERGPAFARDFLAFARGLPADAPADEALAASGHRLYRAALLRLRDETRLSLLQPGRFLMPPPGPEPPWMGFFPLPGSSPLCRLLAERYDAYRDAVRRDLVQGRFAAVDRVLVLADVLAALAAGPAAFADIAAALSAASEALRYDTSLLRRIPLLDRLLPPRIGRVVFAATKADHVAARQRRNLAALMAALVRLPPEAPQPASLAVAAVRATEDFVWALDGRNVSAVRGRVLGESRMTRSYPGEVPDHSPDAAFWAHPFLDVPMFEPMRALPGGAIPELGLDALLVALLGDVL